MQPCQQSSGEQTPTAVVSSEKAKSILIDSAEKPRTQTVHQYVKNSPPVCSVLDSAYSDSNEICNLRVSFEEATVITRQTPQQKQKQLQEEEIPKISKPPQQTLNKSASTLSYHQKSKSAGTFQSLLRPPSSSRKPGQDLGKQTAQGSMFSSYANTQCTVTSSIQKEPIKPYQNTVTNSPIKSRNLSKAESRYLNQPSPSFQSSQGAGRNQSIESNRMTTNRSSVLQNNYNTVSTIQGGTRDTSPQPGQSAFKNAAQIFQKIESTTQRVTGEILENQRLSKEFMAQKKELLKQIDELKGQISKAEKENLKIKEKMPLYQDATTQLVSRIFHKRGKSFEQSRDTVVTRQQIKQLEDDKDKYLQQKMQLKNSLKIEEIRFENMHKQVSELKALLSQNQKEKERLGVEIKKQVKIISNYAQRKNTLHEYNLKYFDNFQYTTSKMLSGGGSVMESCMSSYNLTSRSKF